ncbi:hypothetical protein BDL97_02G163900 [Sphagnum fallax]|nr:hypothetical protein BDL97_02G163900 [Sphagnum fallax]KAH8971850.1 hypothetical protein BDL97_02G163900 [Sphagnum fallax]
MANKSDENMQLLMEWVQQLQRDAPSSLADKATGFYDHHIINDVVIESSEPGRVVFSLFVKPRHVNSDGLLHGGVMASLVDVLGTAALITVGQRVGMSVEINVSFISSAVAEEKLEVEGKVLRAGKNLAVIEVNVRKENGVLVAQGRHTKYLSVAGSKL